jgi:hypothetical protein
MPSRKSRAPIPVPVAGVRRDADMLQMPPEALDVGQNVIVRKNVLVPRAAHENMNWYFDGDWQSLYNTVSPTCICIQSASGDCFVCLEDGSIIYTDDEFATTTTYTISISGYDHFVDMYHDATNNRLVAFQDNGSIYSAPDTWPASGSWAEDQATLDGEYGGFAHDEVTGYTVALISYQTNFSYRIYYSTDSETWAYMNPGRYGGMLTPVGNCELGVGPDSAGTEFFYLRTPTDKLTTDYLGYIQASYVDDIAKNWSSGNDEGTHRFDFAGGGTVTCCLYDDGAENLVDKTGDKGFTYTTELGSGLSYTGSRYCCLFYNSTLGWLVLGDDCYRSADASSWTQYAAPPFSGSQIVGAASDGTDWFVLSEAGVWKFPSTAMGNSEQVVSMFQFDSDDVDGQVIVSGTESIRKLNASTGVFTELGLPVADPPSFDISSNYRGQRTVFRSFPWNGGSGTTLYNYLLCTNPQLPLCYWRSGEDELTTCDEDNAPGARVLLIAANRIIIANIPSWSPYGIAVSGNLDPTSWDGLDKLNAGLLADTPGEITAGAELSALQFAIFKTDAVYHGMAQTEFAGVASAFRYELVSPGIQGPVSPHALCRTPMGSLIYLGQDGGVYQYDGNRPQDIGGHVRRIIETQLDFDSKEDAWGTVDNRERIAYFFFPTVAGNMNRGIAIDLQSYSAWEVQLPPWFQAAAGGPLFITKDLTWADFNVAWREMTAAWNSFQTTDFEFVIGAENNTWGKQKWGDVESYTDFAEPISVRWRNGWSPLGNPDTYSNLFEIHHRMSLLHSGENFTVRAYAADSELDSQLYEDIDYLDSETEYRTSEFDADGMLFRYEISAEITKRFVWGGGMARFKEGSVG